MAYRVQLLIKNDRSLKTLQEKLLSTKDNCIETELTKSKDGYFISTILVDETESLAWLLFSTTLSGSVVWSLNEVRDTEFQRVLEETVLAEEEELGYKFEMEKK